MKKFTKHPITASSNYPKVPAGWSIIPEGNDDDGNWTTLSKTLPNDEGYIWLDMQYDDDDKRYYELSIAFRMKNGNVGPIMSVGANKKFYRLGDAVKYADQYCQRVTSSCNIVNSNYDHRYSAGRIEDDGTEDFYYDTGFDSYDEAFDWGCNHNCTHIYDRSTNEYLPIECSAADSDFDQLAELDYKYSVEGYYDSNFRGLVDSYTGNDFSEALSAAHDFACDGDFIIIKNVQTGRTRSYSTDDWFNAIAYGDYPADVYKIQ